MFYFTVITEELVNTNVSITSVAISPPAAVFPKHLIENAISLFTNNKMFKQI